MKRRNRIQWMLESNNRARILRECQDAYGLYNPATRKAYSRWSYANKAVHRLGGWYPAVEVQR